MREMFSCKVDLLGGEPIGEPAEGAKTLRVYQVKSQLFIRELVGLFDQSTT